MPMMNQARRGTRNAVGMVLIAATLGIVLVLLAPAGASAQTAMRKAGRGLAGMTCMFLEVPGNMVREGRATGPGGTALGFAKGLGMIVVRTLVGVYEFVTCPIPAPAGFSPIIEPEFPWGYFETAPAASRTSPKAR